MALWDFLPEGVFTDTQEFPVVDAPTLDARRYVAPRGAHDTRVVRLRYGVVTSADCRAMREFHRARRGVEAFEWVHPTDARTYGVRFEGGLALSFWTPGFFASGGEVVFRVLSGPSDGGYGEGGYGDGGYGG